MTKNFKEIISQLENLDCKVRVYNENGSGLFRKTWEPKKDCNSVKEALNYIEKRLGQNTTDMNYERDFTVNINKKKPGEIYVFYTYKGTGHNKGPVYQEGKVAYKLEAVFA
jgi:hypothetical protein